MEYVQAKTFTIIIFRLPNGRDIDEQQQQQNYSKLYRAAHVNRMQFPV